MDVVFERKFYGQMLEWKRLLADKYALLVEGDRLPFPQRDQDMPGGGQEFALP